MIATGFDQNMTRFVLIAHITKEKRLKLHPTYNFHLIISMCRKSRSCLCNLKVSQFGFFVNCSCGLGRIGIRSVNLQLLQTHHVFRSGANIFGATGWLPFEIVLSNTRYIIYLRFQNTQKKTWRSCKHVIDQSTFEEKLLSENISEVLESIWKHIAALHASTPRLSGLRGHEPHLPILRWHRSRRTSTAEFRWKRTDWVDSKTPFGWFVVTICCHNIIMQFKRWISSLKMLISHRNVRKLSLCKISQTL